MDDRYFEWLLKKVTNNLKTFKYWKLSEWLFNEPFVWSIRNDENRAVDGLGLRREYISTGQTLSRNIADRPCSILEMLIALSIRCDQDILGDPDVYKGGKLFWIMIDNLGLDVYDDQWFKEDDVADIIDIWLSRRFDTRGNGSIFPCQKPCQNHRKVEIWVQMCDYLNENFDENW